MPQAEATPATLEEAALHGDMIFVEGGRGTDYRSIVYKTFALVQWVVANRQPKFVLKTDDDAYVHTANLVERLRAVRPAACSTCRPSCVEPPLRLCKKVQRCQQLGCMHLTASVWPFSDIMTQS